VLEVENQPSMELVTYLRLFRKWFWLLFLGAFLAGGAAFLRANRQPDRYQASVTIQVGTANIDPNPDISGMYTAEQLAKNYVVLARSYDLAEATVEAGDFPITPGDLRASLSASVITETTLIVLTVTYSDPVGQTSSTRSHDNDLQSQQPTPEQKADRVAKDEITRLGQTPRPVLI
jgi:capsular polysaccharide biosynthesis protein